MSLVFDTDLQSLADAIAGIAIDPDALLSDVGEVLVEASQQRMAEGHDAEGNVWSPWSLRYARERKGPGTRVLQATGALGESITHHADGGDSVVVESALSYAHITQETRPFLGVADSEDELLAVAEAAIEEAYRVAA